MSKGSWRGRGLRRDQSGRWADGEQFRPASRPRGVSLPADSVQGTAMAPFVMKTLHRSHGSGASKKYSLSKNWLLVHTQRYWCRFKHFLKPSVLHVDARLLEKIFGPSRALVPGFEREFKVLLQMREPNSEGKVEILIMGRRRYRKRAKRLIRILAAKPRGKRYGGEERQVPGLRVPPPCAVLRELSLPPLPSRNLGLLRVLGCWDSGVSGRIPETRE